MTIEPRVGIQNWERRPAVAEMTRRDAQHHDTEQPAAMPARQLLIDVSNIAKHDARTGIQRVVRAIASALQTLRLPSTTIRLIAADRDIFYRYLSDDWLKHPDTPRELRLAEYEPVGVSRGDIFLGLDFCASILCRHERSLTEWRAAGVELNIFLYDLLPVTNGRWFTLRMRRNFARWLNFIERRADRVLAISQSVADQFARWQEERCNGVQVPVAKARLGSNISASLPSSGLPADSAAVLHWLEQHPTILMVGTIEPRKGYAQALPAFDLLWRSDIDAPQLLVIGRSGWKTSRLQRKMRRRSGKGRFLWLDQASDEFLEQVFARTAGLLVASEGEGFGLPIVEALSHGVKVLARDLPVFRELEGAGLTFFRGRSAPELAKAISNWLSDDRSHGLRIVRGTADWDSAAKDLADLLMLGATVDPTWSEEETAADGGSRDSDSIGKNSARTPMVRNSRR